MKTSKSAGAGLGSRPARAAPHRSLPRAPGRELAHEVDIVLVDEVWAGQRGLAAPEDVAVVLVEPDRVHRGVALQEWLLVDGPGQLAGGDLRRDLRVEVERADLRLTAVLLAGLDRVQRDRGAERDDEVDARILLELRTDRGLHRGQVPAVDVELVVLTGEGGLDAVAASLQLDLALLLHDAEHVLVAVVGGPLAAGLPGHALVRAEVRQRAGVGVL